MSVLSREEALPKIRLGMVIESNGATVVDYVWSERDFDGSVNPGGKVLALWDGSADPYVTWNFTVLEDGSLVCSTGHYFDTLEPAVADFQRRKA